MHKYVKTFESYSISEDETDDKSNDVGSLKAKTYSFSMPTTDEPDPTPDEWEEAKPKDYVIIISGNKEDGYEMELRDSYGGNFLKINKKVLTDGTMQDVNDIAGLHAYLVDKKKIKSSDTITPGVGYAK